MKNLIDRAKTRSEWKRKDVELNILRNPVFVNEVADRFGRAILSDVKSDEHAKEFKWSLEVERNGKGDRDEIRIVGASPGSKDVIFSAYRHGYLYNAAHKPRS